MKLFELPNSACNQYSGNSSLLKARREKNDEFYTLLEDIEKEMCHYETHFKGKTIYCNCDNPKMSNFWKFFHMNFERLGLKRLTATFYHISNPVYRMDYDGGDDENIDAGTVTPLSGNGDFRSNECIAVLRESDIVVTNPPFSLFREYITQLIEHSKQFIILGNQNAITYKEIFPLIQNNEVWTGYQFGDMKFRVPASSEPRKTRYWVDETGQKWRSLGNAMWLTNLDIDRRHKKLILTKRYNPQEYPKYDNFDAINVRRVIDIPYDYTGIMGVPITIIDKYNSDQFEIVGEFNHGVDGDFDLAKPVIDGKPLFKRIAIRLKKVEKPS